MQAEAPDEVEEAVVFVVDDDLSVRESLALLIRSVGWTPRTFESAHAFLDRAPAPGPCCLLLDLSMPNIDGLALQERVTQQHPDLPIIFVTGHADVPKTVQAMKAGAIEFLTKPLQDDILVRAITGALERSREALQRDSHLRALRDRYAGLSAREREVMALVVAGLLNKQVGSELGISLPTVKAHRGSVMRKMNARSVPDLVNMCAQLGIRPAPKSRFGQASTASRASSGAKP
jgi:FixJ family two-component response regulator